MMQRLFPWALPFLLGFTLVEYAPGQTPRVRWEASYQGAAYNTVTPVGTKFAHSFKSSGYASAGGSAYWRGDGITCTWAVAGTTDGGTNIVMVDIVHDDGGIDCSCSLGTCSGSAAVEKACTCSSAFQLNYGLTHHLMLDAGASGESCLTYPAQMHCTVDLFR